jgi:hypothetical protein
MKAKALANAILEDRRNRKINPRTRTAYRVANDDFILLQSPAGASLPAGILVTWSPLPRPRYVVGSAMTVKFAEASALTANTAGANSKASGWPTARSAWKNRPRTVATA